MSTSEVYMRAAMRAPSVSKSRARAGHALTAVAVLFLLFDGVARMTHFAPYLEGTTRAGFSESLAFPIGLLLLVCTVLYAIPRTAILGAILLTGYLGAATATNLRIGDPYLFPVIFGVVVWAGVFLREPRLAALVPLRDE